MKTGPDISRIATLIGDPARANMLTALMSGQALTAGELAHLAGVTPPTASSHLRQLVEGGLLAPEKQGRHRYFRLAGHEVAELLEDLAGLAERAGHLRFRPGPSDPDLRRARICYDHLAGDLGVALYDALNEGSAFAVVRDGLGLSGTGRTLVSALGIDPVALDGQRRPACRTCLDWSVRRHHLAGSAGAGLLREFLSRGWLKSRPESRALRVTRTGEEALPALFSDVKTGAVSARFLSRFA